MEWKLYLFIKKLYILNLLIGYILYIYEHIIKLIIFENYRKLSYILFIFIKILQSIGNDLISIPLNFNIFLQ